MVRKAKKAKEGGGPKSTPPTPTSRNYLKKLFKNFWDQRLFKYKSTPEVYTNYINDSSNPSRRTYYNSYIIKQVPWKLWLENQVDVDERDRLIQMLNSNDRENVYMAMVIMKQKAGGKM